MAGCCGRLSENRTAKKRTYGLAQGPALANSDLVTLLDTERRRHVRGEVLVALLVPVVLGDVVEVLAADDDGAVHLGRHDGAGQDTAADGDEAGEGALLVCRARVGQSLSLNPDIHKPSLLILLFFAAPLPFDTHRDVFVARIRGAIRIGWERARRFRLFLRTDVLALNGSLGGTETQTNVLVPSPATLTRTGGLDLGLAVEEDCVEIS